MRRMRFFVHVRSVSRQPLLRRGPRIGEVPFFLFCFVYVDRVWDVLARFRGVYTIVVA